MAAIYLLGVVRNLHLYLILFLFFFLIYCFIEGKLLYTILLFSAKHESAIGIHISPPF